MKLYELDQTGIERDLEKTASGIGQTQAARSGEMEPDLGIEGGAPGMDDPAGLAGAGQQPLNQPDPQAGAVPDDMEAEEESKKISEILVSAVQGMAYTDEYDHGDNSKIAPEKILQMNFDELHNLRNLVINKINMIALNNKVGMYDDPGVKWYQDLRDFTDRVLSVKKKADRPAEKKKQGKTAKFDQKPDSKNAKGGKFKSKKRPQ